MATNLPAPAADGDTLNACPLLLSDADVRRIFDLELAYESQQEAFLCLFQGQCTTTDKFYLKAEAPFVTAFGQAARPTPTAFPVMKFGAVAADSASGPSIQAVAVVLDPKSGDLVAIVDATALTALRTAAASALFIDRIADPEASVLALFGSGVQARAHARAIGRIRPLREIRIWSPRREAREGAAANLQRELGIAVRGADSPEEAAAGAALVAACTSSRTPVLNDDILEKDCVAVSVGSYTRERSEITGEVLATATLLSVDDVATALEHAGTIGDAIDAGAIDAKKLIPLGEIVGDAVELPPSGRRIFVSVGLGVQDAVAVTALLVRARELRTGLPLTAWGVQP